MKIVIHSFIPIPTLYVAKFLFRFFYYTAGTGGAGPTILTTSFLLLGEDVIAYNKGTSYFFMCIPMVFLREILSHSYVLLIQEKKSN
jgi:hypothetical protein